MHDGSLVSNPRGVDGRANCDEAAPAIRFPARNSSLTGVEIIEERFVLVGL